MKMSSVTNSHDCSNGIALNAESAKWCHDLITVDNITIILIISLALTQNIDRTWTQLTCQVVILENFKLSCSIKNFRFHVSIFFSEISFSIMRTWIYKYSNILFVRLLIVILVTQSVQMHITVTWYWRNHLMWLKCSWALPHRKSKVSLFKIKF